MASTITSRSAKMYVKNAPKIQSGYDYVDTVRIIQQRNKNLYESQWFVTNETLKVLYHKFLEINQESSVSHGTFLALKPFYLRSGTTKDIKMCCCKKHLHIQWLVKALIDCAAKQTLALVSSMIITVFLTISQRTALKKNLHTSIGIVPLISTLYVMISKRIGTTSKTAYLMKTMG